MDHYIDDLDTLYRREHERETRLNRRPKCTLCGELIQSEYCYKIGEDMLCQDCLNEEHRFNVESLID